MTKFWLSLSITLAAATATAAEPVGRTLPVGSVCILPDPDAAVTFAPPPNPSPLELWITVPTYALPRGDAEEILVERKAGRQAIEALRKRDQEDPTELEVGPDPVPWLIGGGAVLVVGALIGGIFAGAEYQKARQ